jgi:hypothetical protein
VIPRPQRFDFGRQPGEIRRTVNQRLNAIALAPRRNVRRGITAFYVREKPMGQL